MPKNKTTVRAKTSPAARSKRTKSKEMPKKPSLRHARFHLPLLLLGAIVAASLIAYKSLVVHASSTPAPLVDSYTGTFTQYGMATAYAYKPAGKLTVSLSYTGEPDGSVALDAYTYDRTTSTANLLTVSSYGNPITIHLDAGANITNLAFEIWGPVNTSASYTLTFSNAEDPTATTTSEPFLSMPCSFVPQKYVYPFDVEPPIWPCPGYTNLSFRSRTSPIPDPPSTTPTPSPTSPSVPPPITKAGDFSAPSTPLNLQAHANGPNDIGLTWSAATDTGSGVAGYYIYRGSSPTNTTKLATVNTPSYSDKSVNASTTYYYYVVAFDKAGNASQASIKVNATTPDVPPILPTIGISNPKSGATVSGIITVDGMAGSSVSPTKSVTIEVDNSGFVNASILPLSGNTVDYKYAINTRLYTDTVHTITAKVTAQNGTSQTATTKLIFKNGTYSKDPPLAQGTWVSPEGMTIVVNSTGKNPHTGQPWTIADLYYMIKSCAVGTGDFSTIAPYYTAEILDNIGNLIPNDAYTRYSISNSSGNPNWYNYGAATYFRGATGAMLSVPYDVACYEYGHVWTEYYYYMVDYPIVADVQDSTSPAGVKPPLNYLTERWVKPGGTVTLAQDNLCTNSVDYWDGCISDDRRILFGGTGPNGGDNTAERVPGEPDTGYKETYQPYVNSSIVPPQSQPGLADWYKTHWMTGQ